MRVLCSNHSSRAYLALVRENPDHLGWLIGPSNYKSPRVGVPFVLDNDAYLNYKNGESFDSSKWKAFLDKVKTTGHDPLWIVVPDVVADRDGTIQNWVRFSPTAHEYGWPLAFVVQDGMTSKDIPGNCDLIFVGGTTSWKWRSIPMWCKTHPRVHVGRCGTSRWKLDRLEQLGVESCDGSGFFRATINGREARQLLGWLYATDHQPELAFK